MIDHIILTVSNVERSLAFYEAALAPLDNRRSPHECFGSRSATDGQFR
jgi:catechol 2,3-dioxygenase-like lactoylglutathione lyase family enzyme